MKKDLPKCLKTAVCVIFFAAFQLSAAGTQKPAEKKLSPLGELNRILKTSWQNAGLTPVKRVSDAVWLRRVWLDVTGKLPPAAEVRRFLANRNPRKRQAMIDMLLASESYAGYSAMIYCDMFRVKSEFPINLWPNAVQLYHRYFLEAARYDRPWNQITRELLTANGSNFRVAPANFFRAVADRSPAGRGEAVALSFMGMQTQRWSEADREAFGAFFSRVRTKSTDEWKEEIVYNDPEPCSVTARTPDGHTFVINSPAEDPRQVFADWLLAEENPWFARSLMNRLWYRIFGRGIIDPADDLQLPPDGFERFLGFFGLRELPPEPVNPELLDFLASEFRRRNYRIKPMLRLILASDAYNADWRTVPEEQLEAEKLFAVYPVRRMRAEVLLDAIASVTGSFERYTSVIPEPFTFIPPGTPAVWVADGSISTGTLDNFGRPPRDSGKFSERNSTVTESQRLWLMNSGMLYRQLGRAIRDMRNANRRQWKSKSTELIYLTVLSRYPTAAERKVVAEYTAGMQQSKRWQASADLLWALFNSKEFIYHH